MIMAEVKKHEEEEEAPKFDLNAKWDACIDLGVRRFFYASLIGGFSGLLLFRSPATRWASAAFGAGTGLGSAYTECSHRFGGFRGKSAPNVSAVPVSKDGED